ncbi:HlyD family secretion protein [Sphingomonas sp. ASV193]|uniref:HlyD family secretion protein n=1 Tax=Sphingomonas sp. ASV193 TaxID=3144405 RepID=UPI0032E8D31B
MTKMSKIDGDTATEVPLEEESVVVAPKRRINRKAIMAAVPLLVVAVGLYMWLTSGHTVSTDNAYVKQDIVGVSTQISGPVVKVFVRENQLVHAGDPLFQIDPAPTQVSLLNAQAQLATAELQTRQLKTTAAGTGGDIVGARANLAIQQQALARQSALLKQGFTTKASYDDAVNEVAKARAQLADAQAAAANASAAVAPDGQQPQVALAEAAIAKAQLDLRHGLVRAPVTGYVSQSERLLPGQTAITGVNQLSIVRDQNGWVEANFKEGDLARMAVGQPAIVTFDAYPGLKVKSHVCGIGSGTGSQFSVLPAQNANGNWVKVTQRVPVRVCFDSAPARKMIAGLSANVDVRIDGKAD